MSSITVALFCEDYAHESFVRAMVERLSFDEACPIVVRVHAAQGGHGAAITEFDRYQMLLEKNVEVLPDIAIVAIDANCRRFARAVQEIEGHTRAVLSEKVVTACPDPHIERWYIADPESFARTVGAAPRLVRRKCKRGFYKGLLADAVRKAGHPLTLGGIEFAGQIVMAMDLDRASANDRALGRFVSATRGAIRIAQT